VARCRRPAAPRSGVALQDEARAIQTRHETIGDAMRAVRACGAASCCASPSARSSARSRSKSSPRAHDVSEVTIQATLRAVRREVVPPEDAALDFSVIAMGRFGGGELGFGSDADVLYVYDANGVDPERAHELSRQLVAGLRSYSEDHRVPFDLDADLRPEGRNGPLVRSLDSYAEYYRRWSLSWEAQALLRARGVAGSVKLIRRFMAIADEVRYPAHVAVQDLREIKRIKARVENERLPQGVDRRAT
jgi:glutamate-ammonia-ligase adenylyltransferase